MRPITAWVWSAVGSVVVAGSAFAQQGQPVVIPPQTAPVMPGTAIGKPIVMPVGNRLPNTLPQVGTGPNGIPTALNPLGAGPNAPQIDPKNVIAPYPGMPKPPPSIWEQLEQRWSSLFQSDTPVVRTMWTPGIARRNREREKERQRWQRD